MSSFFIGTSGWHYKHWVGPFYPEGMQPSDFLAFYADRFNTVEINNSFYRLPSEDTFRQWSESTPEGFLFAVKANRYITHMKKLKDPAEPVANFLGAAVGLREKFGPVLFQLPPRWRINSHRLDAFLEALPGGGRYAFEFRDQSWFDERVYQILRDHQAAFCIYELAGLQSPKEVTTDFIYIRLHGPGNAYEGSYRDEDLQAWVSDFRIWAEKGRDVYCYFDNDQSGYAVQNALRLKEMLA